jgi:hypothetical protein
MKDYDVIIIGGGLGGSLPVLSLPEKGTKFYSLNSIISPEGVRQRLIIQQQNWAREQLPHGIKCFQARFYFELPSIMKGDKNDRTNL